MADLVRYNNDINKVPLRNLTEKELNIFFSLIFKAKEEKTRKINMSFTELRNLSNGDTHNSRFIKALDSMDKKLLNLNQSVEIKKGVFKRFNLFNDFTIDTNENTLTVSIHELFSYMLNDLIGNYTKFELQELISFKSSYSKNVFRLMKQWESIKKLDIKLDEFKRILCIPESYKFSKIDQRVLKPVMEELGPIFNNLKLEKVKKGRSIDKLIFTWGNRNILTGETTCKGNSVKSGLIEEVVISEGLNKAIEKVKKNRFIKPLITNGNIEKLLKKFTDQELTRGLPLADKKVNTEIKSLNYIITTIENELKENQIKIVIKKSEPKDLQGVESKEEVKEELTEEIKEPTKIIDKDLEYFREETLKELENQKTKNKNLKHGQYSVAKVLIGKAQNYEQISNLILKYELN